MNIGNVTTSIAKVFYAPLDETRYLNTDGYYRFHVKEVYEEDKIKELILYLIDKFQDNNSLVFVLNDDDNFNLIKSEILINLGFIVTDSKNNHSLYVYKNSDDVSDVLFN